MLYSYFYADETLTEAFLSLNLLVEMFEAIMFDTFENISLPLSPFVDDNYVCANVLLVNFKVFIKNLYSTCLFAF